MKTAVTQSEGRPGAVELATVVEVLEPGRVALRSARGGAGTKTSIARLADLGGYSASIGDRVLVASDGEESYVVAVVHAARPRALALPDGGLAELSGGALEVRDAEGRLMVRYANGTAEIAAPSGDLRLSAGGRVLVHAGTDLEMTADRDLLQRSGRALSLDAGGEGGAAFAFERGSASLRAHRVEVRAGATNVETGEASLTARAVQTTAERVLHTVGRYELTATRMVHRARDAFRDVSDLAQDRVGRARTVVREAFTLHARRTVVVSKDDTSIDGRKVLLG